MQAKSQACCRARKPRRRICWRWRWATERKAAPERPSTVPEAPSTMLRNRQRELSIAVAILAIAAVLAAVAPAFFSFANVRDLLLANVPVLIVGVGMTLIGI